MDFAADGTAWIAEGGHPNIPDSRNRVLRAGADGAPIDTVDTTARPNCVRVDRATGFVWVAGSDGLWTWDAGSQPVSVDSTSTWSVAVEPETGWIWQGTWTDVRLLRANGTLVRTIAGFDGPAEKVIAVGL